MATWTLVMSGDLMKTAASNPGNPRGRPFAKGESGNPAALVRALEANEFEQRLQKIEEWKDRGGGGRKNQRK
jgi:hypothetical protein